MNIGPFGALTGFLCLALVTLTAAAQANSRFSDQQFTAARTTQSAVIDGELNESLWQQASVIDDFHQVYPNEFAPPAEATQVLVIYNRDYLYIAARLFDSDMAGVSKKVIVPGQAIWDDDMFAVSLDTFNDKKDVYYFATNLNAFKEEALGVNNQSYIDDWDGVWDVATSVQADHWVVEMAIPFKTLSFNPDNGNFGINFSRELKNPQQQLFWNSHGSTTAPWAAEHTGTMAGITGISQGHGLDIKLSATANVSRDYAADHSESNFSPSLDLFYKPTPEITTALTVNTDFSATEVDQQQVNLTRFSLFLPEKRDFFLQDAGVFEFAKLSGNGQPFFSRTLGLSNDGSPLDINIGSKITGNLDKFSFGFVGVDQDISAEQTEQLYVLRTAVAVSPEFQAGIIATHGSPNLNEQNHLTGADFQYRNKQWLDGDVVELIGWYQHSDTQLAEQRLSDYGYGASVALPNERLNMKLSYLELGENFSPGLGFVNRTGIKEYDGWINVSSSIKPEWADRIYHGVSFNKVTDLHNQTQSSSTLFTLLQVMTQQEDYFLLEYNNEFDRVPEAFEILPGLTIPAGDYDFSSAHSVLLSPHRLPFEWAASWRYGDFYDGTQNDMLITAASNINANVRLSLDYGYNQVKLGSGNFDIKTMSAKIDIAFSSRLFWNNWFQYNNVSAQLGIFSRLRWQPDALSQLDVVLNHVFLDEQHFHSYRQDMAAKLSYRFRF